MLSVLCQEPPLRSLLNILEKGCGLMMTFPPKVKREKNTNKTLQEGEGMEGGGVYLNWQ